MELKTAIIHNLGFFGGNREGLIQIDGHYKIIFSKTEFLMLKIGGWGNLTSFPEIENPTPETCLTENSYRFAHDEILEYINRKPNNLTDATERDTTTFNTSKKYDLHDKRISANIYSGDSITNLKTGESFTVNAGVDHDIKYIRKNFWLKLKDRDLHPEPARLETFISENEAINPFKDWDKLNALPKNKKEHIVSIYVINNEDYTMVEDYSGKGVYYIVTPKKEVYKKESSISAPYYDCIDLLTGLVKTEYENGSPVKYTYKNVEHKTERYKQNFKKITDLVSYDYNR
jgi:hypothetical protein